MSPSLANFLFESVNLLLLAAGLSWLLFKPVKRALDAEVSRRAAELAESKQALADAHETQARADALAAKLREEAERRDQERLEATRAEASKLLSDARADIERDRKAFTAELKADTAASMLENAELVGRIAADAVRELLSALDGPALDHALVERAIPELRQLGEEGKQGVSVESARPLSAQSKQALAALLGTIEERVVPELGAGVRITTRAGRIDATASALARQAAAALQRALTPDPEEAGA